MQMPELTNADLHFQDLLLQNQLLSSQQINQTLAAREQAWQRLLRQFVGLYCVLRNGELQLEDFTQARPRANIPLTAGDELFQLETPVTLFIDPEDGKLLEPAFLAPESLGLLMTPKSCWLLAEEPAQAPFLGQTLRHQSHNSHDLFVSPRKDLLVVSEREQGVLHLIAIASQEIVQTVEVREPGLASAINVCISPQSGEIWLTDQDSPRLGRIDPQNFELSWYDLQVGTLGQLTLSAESNILFILALAPTYRLISLDIKSMGIIGELQPPGYPCSLQADVPTDSLVLLPESQDLALLSMVDGPHGDLQATIQIVNTRIFRIFEQYPLPHVSGFATLMPGRKNPFMLWQAKRLEEWVIELGFLTAELLMRLRHDDRLGAVIHEDAAYQVPQGDEHPLEIIERRAPRISLPQETPAVIVEMLVQGFQMETGISLREHEREMERLQRQAEHLQQELEDRYVALVELDKVAREHSLQMVITRENLLRALDLHLGGKTLPFRPSHKCPMCHVGLNQPRLCQHCGFQLDDPSWIERRHRQSAEAFSELIPGQMVLALPHVRQVVFLDAWLQVIQEIRGKADGSFMDPQHVLALPNRNWLVCDRDAGLLVEITPLGELVRVLTEHFQEPVLASFQRENEQLSKFLVVDRKAAEVCVLDSSGQLLSRWGKAQGLELQAPNDLQWTWADTLLVTDPEGGQVIEWDPVQQNPLLIFNRSQGLERPVMARRQLNGEYLIVDAKRGEVLFFNEAQVLARHFQYWPPPDQDAAYLSQSAPDRILVLPQGDLLALGRKFWMQIQPGLGKIRWVQPWTGDRRPPNQKTRIKDMSEESESVRALRMFEVLSRAETTSLELFLASVEPVQAEAGQMILKPEDMSGILYFIREGEVAIVREGMEQPLTVLKAGEVFGVVPLIFSEPYPAGFQALTDVSLYQMQRSKFKLLVMKFAELVPKLRELAHQHRAILHQYQNHMHQSMMDKVKAQLAVKKLQELGLFKAASESFLEDLAQRMRPLAFMPRQQVFAQGESGDTLYFIARGKVGIYLPDQEQPFQLLEAGEVFGEIALIKGQPRAATVITESYCQLYELDAPSLELAFQQDNNLKPQLEALADQRLQSLEAELERLAALAQEPERLPCAEVISLQRVRPALAWQVSSRWERVACFDESGQYQWLSDARTGTALYRPTRLHVSPEQIWVADTGNDRGLALSPGDGHYLRTLSGSKLELQRPRSFVPAGPNRLLIADEGNQRLLLVSEQGDLLWEYTTPHEIMAPWYAEQTPKGTVLFCDRELQMVFEVDPRSKEVVWSYGVMLSAGDGPGELNEPSCVRRLKNGATLILDTGNNRLLLCSPVGTLMRTFEGNEEIGLVRPLHAEVLDNGEILVYPEHEDAIVRLGMSGQPVWAALLSQ